jgi:MFS family permease
MMVTEVTDMVKWIKNINWHKTLLSAIIYTVIATVIRQIETVMTMKYYLMPEYFGVWSKLMMPNAGPPPFSFILTSIIITFVSGICLCLIYYYVRDWLPKKQRERIFYFADLTIGTSFVFFTLPAYLMFNLPAMLLVSWFVSGFIILVSASYTFVKLIG